MSDSGQDIDVDNEPPSKVLDNFVESRKLDDFVSVRDLKDVLHERGFAFLMFVFSFPLSIPVPVPPGVTTVGALPLLFFAAQMLLDFDSPWLPKYILKKKIKRSFLALVVEKSSPYLRKMEKLMHYRIAFLVSGRGEKLYALFSLLFAISIAIPLPLTNFIPAAGIAVMSLGIMSKDGLFVVLGAIVGTVGLVITTAVILLGASFVRSILGI